MPGRATSPNRPTGQLASKAARALGMSQREFGDLLGVSRRTAARYMWGDNTLSVSNLHKLARLIHPRDPALAAELAEAASETLESLGIVKAVVPSKPLIADAVVCVAAEALDASPRAVRAAIHAAFKRARGWG